MFSKFPSLQFAAQHAGATLRRFPFTLTCAAVVTCCAIYLVEEGQPQAEDLAGRWLLTAALGGLLFLALSTWAERQPWSDLRKRLFPGVGLLVLIPYYLSLPASVEEPYSTMMRFALLAIGLHFLIAFLPFTGRDQISGFWQYNKALFIRFLLAALYSSVLYVGLAIAVAAADHLFGMDIDEKIYVDLWIVISALFNTWVFLAGVPADLGRLNDSQSYPKGLKVFTQYILLPLVALYFVILIVYEAKIVATWNWPQGWVSNLVLWYSVVGILSLLLLYPQQKKSENRWIAVFGTWFFRALIPLVVMLYLAILERVSDYGITVNRHLVLAMATGLAVVVLYFVFSRARDIRIIPMVLCALAFLSAYGPQSAFSISKSSQRGRLEAYMLQHQVLVDGTIQAAPELIPIKDRREMSSIVRYLGEWHGTDAFAGWIPDSVLAIWEDSLHNYQIGQSAAEQMGFALTTTRWDGTDGEHFAIGAQSDDLAPLPIAGYDYLVKLNFDRHVDSLHTITLDGTEYRIGLYANPERLEAVVADSIQPLPDGSRLVLDSLILEIVRDQAAPQHSLPEDQLHFDLVGGLGPMRLIVRHLSGRVVHDSVTVERLQGSLLIGKP